MKHERAHGRWNASLWVLPASGARHPAQRELVAPVPELPAHRRLRPARAAAAPMPCGWHTHTRTRTRSRAPNRGTTLGASVCLQVGTSADVRGTNCPGVAAHRACYRAGGAPALRDGGTVLLTAEAISLRVIPHILLHCSLRGAHTRPARSGGRTQRRSEREEFQRAGPAGVGLEQGGGVLVPKSSTVSCTRSIAIP